MYISQNIKYLRAKLGMKQVEVAEKIGKTSAAISDYEKGKANPPLEVAVQLSEIFNVPVGDLIQKDLRKADLLGDSSHISLSDADYRARYEALKKQFAVQESLTVLQAQRLQELEREIREQAPELAKRLGLEG